MKETNKENGRMNHIRNNDLRIGNFVRISKNGEIVRVSGITTKKIRYHKRNDRSTNLLNRKYSEIEPVKIIEVKDYFEHPKELYWADKEMCQDLYYYKGVVITDFHELQNIHFAFTGNEIEIEL